MPTTAFEASTYGAEGHITAVDSGSTAQYLYNALGQRVRTVVGSTATEFVFNAAGQRVSDWNGSTHAQLQGKYYWGGRPVAYYAGGAAHFEHQDWLGTERMRTTYNGGVEGSFASLPFGDGLTTVSGADLDANHYAMLDHDYESDTEHAQFRQYSSAQGRWLSPDPYAGSYDGSNPQSFNRYVYAANNPLSATDPTGLYRSVPGQCDEYVGFCSQGAAESDDNDDYQGFCDASGACGAGTVLDGASAGSGPGSSIQSTGGFGGWSTAPLEFSPGYNVTLAYLAQSMESDESMGPALSGSNMRIGNSLFSTNVSQTSGVNGLTNIFALQLFVLEAQNNPPWSPQNMNGRAQNNSPGRPSPPPVPQNQPVTPGKGPVEVPESYPDPANPLEYWMYVLMQILRLSDANKGWFPPLVLNQCQIFKNCA